MVEVQVGEKYIRDIVSVESFCSQRRIQAMVAMEVIVTEKLFALLIADSCVNQNKSIAILDKQ